MATVHYLFSSDVWFEHICDSATASKIQAEFEVAKMYNKAGIVRLVDSEANTTHLFDLRDVIRIQVRPA